MATYTGCFAALSVSVAVLVLLVLPRHTSATLRPDALSPTGAAVGTLRAVNDVDVLPFPAHPVRRMAWRSWNGTVASTGRSFTGHVACLDDPALFSFEVLPDGCAVYHVTSETAEAFDCLWATNGGFFNLGSSGCIGNIVINETVHALPAANTANFGVTVDGRFVNGYLDAQGIAGFKFTQLLSGVGWLVRKGASNVKHSPDLNPTSGFTTEKAPRTAVGVAHNGSLIVLQVDGQEDIHAGVDLYEFADILISVGAYSAVNFDGGGSSVSVLNGTVVSRPTCHDTSQVCERRVSTITCIRQLD